MGNRITKAVFHKAGGARNGEVTYTHYVRDASGNTMAVYKRQQNATNDATLTDHLTLNEQHLYGSSRLGLRSLDNTLNSSTFERLPDLNLLGEYQVGTQIDGGAAGFTASRTNRPLGAKHYELSNHLGNVLATVSDRKLWDGATRIADVKSASDYYPFGMNIGDRTMSLAGYRYGFNGKEKDPSGEWGSQAIYDYGFRIYNPGLGKFLSVDPLADSYPWNSTYAFAENDVIRSVDLDGAEKLIKHTFNDNSDQSRNVRLVHAFGVAHAAYTASELSTNRKDVTPLGEKKYLADAVVRVWEYSHHSAPDLSREQHIQLYREGTAMLMSIVYLGFTCEACLEKYADQIINVPGYDDRAYVLKAVLIEDMIDEANAKNDALGMLSSSGFEDSGGIRPTTRTLRIGPGGSYKVTVHSNGKVEHKIPQRDG